MAKVNKNKVVIYANHKDNQEGLELRNQLQADGKQPILQNPDFIGGPVEDAGHVIIFGRDGHPVTEKVKERYEDTKAKVKVKESPALKRADKRQEQRQKTGGNEEATGGPMKLPAPTEQETVKQIKGWLDYNDVDYNEDMKKAELLELVQKNS